MNRLETIALQDATPQGRQIVSVVDFTDSGVPGRDGRIQGINAFYADWNRGWRFDVNETLRDDGDPDSAWTVLYRFSDGTWGMSRRQDIDAALAEFGKGRQA